MERPLLPINSVDVKENAIDSWTYAQVTKAVEMKAVRKPNTN